MLTRRDWLRIGLGVPVGMASSPLWGATKEFWETKPHAEWNSAEVERMLTKSPWAKEVLITEGGRMSTGGGYPGGGNRGGYPGGGGIGFPGGGVGYPGGGYPGGGRYPGGGYPGGGYPGGPNGGNYPDDRRGGRAYHATLRWESSQAIQDALRLGPEDASNPDFAKYYVLSLIGDFPDDRLNRDDRGVNNRDSDDRGNRDDDEDADRQKRRRDAMFNEFTKLERKDGFVKFEKVVEGSRFGSSSPGTAFYFSRLDNITPDDKVISFYTKVNNAEVRAKFTLKEMMYQGKLAL